MSLLRERTARAHETVESLMPDLGALATRAGYVHALLILEAFFRQWEPAVFAALDEQLVPALHQRHKHSVILADLASLGITPLSAAPDAAPPLDRGRALGALYVMEGSSLGARVIERVAAPALGVNDRHGGRFFHGYGEHTGDMWRAFGDAVTGWASTDSRSACVVDGAITCFDALAAWLARNPLDVCAVHG